MALAALRAGEHELGADLVERATAALADGGTEDERIELAVAFAELLRMRGDPHGALRALQQAVPPAYAGAAAGPGLRAHCLLFRALADLSEELGEVNQALAYLRTWQGLNARRMQDASRARFQAAALQTELLRLQHERDEIDARRRSSERAQQQLQAANRALSQKVEQVQALQAALRDQAVRDFLTGLYNRRHLNEVMPAMLALAERDTEPLAVVLIDLDHFKAVNDEHGHAAGDTVLAEFGALLARRLRKSDVACRYGGEEFCLLLPRTDARAARRKIASLQDAWRARTFAFETGSVRGCTFSAGITDSLDVRGSLEALLRAADAGGLEAKRRGRDRIVVFEPGAQRRGAAASVLGTVAGE
jgi:diguanylate cyclase (GGDEF)-like protein